MLIFHHQNFFKNFYEILTKSYNIRMLIAHGDCNGRGYGFLNHIKQNYKLKNNPAVYNFGIEPDTSSVWINDVFKKKNLNNIILLNYDGEVKKELKIQGKNIKLSNYKLVYNKDRCFYFSKDD
tara:strand:+ start:168 stop:536 length:369 start_codon:yes stop_codon:yes gene_type:complete